MDFAELAQRRDEDVDWLTGAVLIARDAHPSVEHATVSQELDALAAPLGDLSARSSRDAARLIATRLFEAEGFRGDEENYYAPENSYIDAVLHRRSGIPITLSLVMVEVARRAGVTAYGVGFPGHFLVRFESREGEPLFVDPFEGGHSLSRLDLERLAAQVFDAATPLDPAWLEPSPTRLILKRMLMNLRNIFVQRGELARLMVVLSRLIELLPDDAGSYRDRGLVASRLGAREIAEADLNRYLTLAPNAGDVAEVRRFLEQLADPPFAPN